MMPHVARKTTNASLKLSLSLLYTLYCLLQLSYVGRDYLNQMYHTSERHLAKDLDQHFLEVVTCGLYLVLSHHKGFEQHCYFSKVRTTHVRNVSLEACTVNTRMQARLFPYNSSESRMQLIARTLWRRFHIFYESCSSQTQKKFNIFERWSVT